jgi:hypothetical protein
MRALPVLAALAAAALLLSAAPLDAFARTLEVGPGKPFVRPSQAARAAQAGDRIVIAPGRYQDCAVLAAPDLTVEAAPGGAVEIFGPVCAGKGLFITTAPRITIIGITFQGASGPSGNGAGIRAEGGDLTVRASRFVGNQNGILAPSGPTAHLVVEDSIFTGNGAREPPSMECAHGIYVGPLAVLSITRSRFEATRICHHVKSRALRTEITDTHIIDGADTRSSYLVDVPNGGDLLLARSVLRKGPGAGNTTIAVAIGAEGVRHPTKSLRIEGVDFANLQSVPTAFVRNWSQVPVIVTGTRLAGPGPVTPIQGPGEMR